MSVAGSRSLPWVELRSRWQELADRHGLSIAQRLAGSYGIRPKSQALAYKTLITQEMLKKGFLRLELLHLLAHTPDVLEIS